MPSRIRGVPRLARSYTGALEVAAAAASDSKGIIAVSAPQIAISASTNCSRLAVPPTPTHS